MAPAATEPLGRARHGGGGRLRGARRGSALAEPAGSDHAGPQRTPAVPFASALAVHRARQEDYVEAARALGASQVRIIGRHILPNTLAPVIVQTTLGVGSAVLEAAGLSFLGLGAQAPTPEWGAMLTNTREYLRDAPWAATFPGIAILLTVVGCNLLGDGLRDALDPRLRQ